MSFEWVTPALLGLLAAIVLWIALRKPRPDPDAERQARDLRDEIARSAQGTRQEVVATLGDFQRTLLAQQNDVARTQNELIEAFGRQLATTQQQLGGALGQATLAQVEQARLARDSLDQALEGQGTRQAASLKDLSATLSLQLEALVRANDQRMAEVRLAVDGRPAQRDPESDDDEDCEKCRDQPVEMHGPIVAARTARPQRAPCQRGRPRRDQRSARSNAPCTSSASAAAGSAPASMTRLSLTARPATMRSPKPPAPMNAAIVAVPTLITAAVLTPAMSVGAASGSWTWRNAWRDVMPSESAACAIPPETLWRPAWVLRRIGSSA